MTSAPVCIGQDHGIFGIVHEPRDRRAPRAVLVTFNAGLLHRAGPHRLPVLLGRALAARGFVTLRIDQNGIGDTPRRPGSHQAGVDADTQAVLAWCASRYPGAPVVLLGLCSGADDVLAAGHADTQVAGMILLDGYAPRTWRYHLHFWWWRITRLDAWLGLPRRLWAGRAARDTAAAAEDEETDLRDWADQGTMLRRLRGVVDRGSPVLAVFTGAVIDYYSHEGQLAAALDFPSGLTECRLADCNHLFELAAQREALIGRVCAWLESHWPERI